MTLRNGFDFLGAMIDALDMINVGVDENRLTIYPEIKVETRSFKDKDEPKPKKERIITNEPFAKHLDKLTDDYLMKVYKKVGKIIDNDTTTITTFANSHTIKRVIINPPAVIILWDDGTKTMAKCEKGEKFDAEKGFSIALAKKFVGNERFRKMLKRYVWGETE